MPQNSKKKKSENTIKNDLAREDQLEEEKLLFEKPLIVPPGLNKAILDFEAHFKISDDNPILILGDTGVGKSLFLYLLRKLFREKYKNEDVMRPILTANCSHFQPNFAKSELFGHVKGAFTDAIKAREGLIAKADGGLLILEEIGTLPREVQAMLLVFIETGKYYPLGSDEIKEANVKIVGATNLESALRDDFRYRFSPFYIPPIRERKGDILYYLYQFSPDIIESLSPSDILILLTHNWPGNVREIERIGNLIKREKWINDQIEKNSDSTTPSGRNVQISHLNPKDTSFNPWLLDDLVFCEFPNLDIDVDSLNKQLKKYRVSVSSEKGESAFKKILKKNNVFSWYNKFSLKFYNNYGPFDEAVNGYELFCRLFSQDPEQNANILEKISKGKYSRRNPPEEDSRSKYEEKLAQLVNTLHQKLFNTASDDHEIPFSEKAIDEVSKLTEKELLTRYHEKVLEKAAGNVSLAARRVGLKESTLRNRLKKLGVTPKRT